MAIFPARLPRVAGAVAITAAMAAATIGADLGAAPSTASPAPTIHQVEKRIAAINIRAEKITEAYDAARGSLRQLENKAEATHRTLLKDQRLLSGMQGRIRSIATAAYESEGISGATSMLESGNPELLLQRAVDLGLVAHSRQAELAKAMAANRAVEADQATYDGELAAEHSTIASIITRREQIQTLLSKAHAQLKTLKAAQRARLAAEQARRRHHELMIREAYLQPARSPAHKAVAAPVTGAAAAAVRFAYAQLGKPYVYGAAGPDSYDCSGLTMRAWGAAGVALAHNAAEQQASVPSVSMSDLQPGDLVFFGVPAYHVAIYVGSGNIIQAPHTGADVEVTPLSYMPPASGAGRP